MLSIDWITFSKTAPLGPLNEVTSIVTATSEALAALHKIGVVGTLFVDNVKPDPFYAYGFKETTFGVKVDVAGNLHDQGIKITLSGETLRRTKDAADILATGIKAGWRVTRLDIAYDMTGKPPKVVDIYNSWMARHGNDVNKAKSFIGGPTGDTFYVGSRTSPKFMRIYDKGGKQGVGRDYWTRIELEFKQQAAGELALQVLDNINYAAFHMNALLDDPDTLLSMHLEGLAKYAPKIRSRAPRVASSREVWFMRQVIPALKKLKDEDFEVFERIVTEMLILADYGKSLDS